MLRALCLLLLIVAASTTVRAGYPEGVAAYGSGDYERAAREFHESAASGDAESQYMLGRLYALGAGVPEDYVEAWIWLDRAAQQNLQEAQDARDTIAGILTPGQLALARTMRQAGREVAIIPRPATPAPSTLAPSTLTPSANMD